MPLMANYDYVHFETVSPFQEYTKKKKKMSPVSKEI